MTKYYNLTNQELINIINQLPNISSSNDCMAKELKMDNYSILIYFEKHFDYFPNILVLDISFYEKISFFFYTIKDDIKYLIRADSFSDDFHKMNKDLFGGSYNIVYQRENHYNYCELINFLEFVRTLSKFQSLKAFV